MRVNEGQSQVDYSSYVDNYNSKCGEWRTEPVEGRRCNDIICTIIFFLFTGFFITVGIVYIIKYDGLGGIDIGDLTAIKYKGTIIACLVSSIFISFIYIFLIRLMPKIMVLTMIFITLGVFAVLSVVGFIIGSLAMGIAFGVVFLIYVLVLFCFKDKIRIGIVLIKVSAQFLSQKVGVFISPFIKIILCIGLNVFFFISIASIIGVGDRNSSKNESRTTEDVFTGVFAFLYIFYNFVFYYMMVFTIATACAYWYYQVDKNFFITAYRWMFTSNFGSIIFASFVIAIVTFARMLVNSGRRKNKNIIAAVCLCLIACCLRSIEQLLRILNHNSIIVMAVTGESYIESAKTTIGILSRFLPLLTVTDIISNLLIFWGVVLSGGVAGTIGYFWVRDASDLDDADKTLIIILIVVGSIMLSIIILSILIEAVSSVFIFYCFDVRFRELGYGAHNMPEQINYVLMENGSSFERLNG